MSTDTIDWVGEKVGDEGRYLINEKLGEGGMGFVYRALDRRIDTSVVIKVPRRAMLEDPEFAKRFELEIASLVKLKHRSIVRVSDVGKHQGVPFAIMECLSGGDLTDRMKTNIDGHPVLMEPQEIGNWVQTIAAALDFVHGKGYIHRDVKPPNILFDENGDAYLSDFGVAKVVAENSGTSTKLTGTGMVLGTPEYMAPELLMGQDFDGRVDQYALAVTVHEVLCGHVPFTGATPAAVVVSQTQDEPVPLCERFPEIPLGVSNAVQRGLAKIPDARFATCAEFASAVVEGIRNSPFTVTIGPTQSPGAAARRSTIATIGNTFQSLVVGRTKRETPTVLTRLRVFCHSQFYGMSCRPASWHRC